MQTQLQILKSIIIYHIKIVIQVFSTDLKTLASHGPNVDYDLKCFFPVLVLVQVQLVFPKTFL